MPEKFTNGPFGCCGNPGGCGTCCMTACCPCYAFYTAAEDIGDSNGALYCVATLLGFGPCMLCLLADKVAQARNIDQGMPMHALCACCECVTCFSCAVVNEAKLYKEQSGAPGGQKIEGR
ncbi:unnamed protein product [Cylindrotheca closterium]|uniref:Uncharacterized protein n=1 Tax=Cylindrotheca closterium TaxID=2856 RepID=A0AAD2G1Z6_9STRA|nr:unnamed protein product [Cylindrotheca closterium]